MLNRNLTRQRTLFTAIFVVIALTGPALVESRNAWAGGGCALVPNDRDPSEKTLRCGQELTVRSARGTRFKPVYETGQPLPTAMRLDDGALLIEFHPSSRLDKCQILTPLAVAAVRGTKFAVEVKPDRTSTLVLAGTVAVTNRRLNQYVILGDGQGVDISPSDTTVVQKQWREARVRALLSRFGE